MGGEGRGSRVWKPEAGNLGGAGGGEGSELSLVVQTRDLEPFLTPPPLLSPLPSATGGSQGPEHRCCPDDCGPFVSVLPKGDVLGFQAGTRAGLIL